MKNTVNRHQFITAFDLANRSDSFSYQGRAALFDFFEELEEDIGEEIELDVIAVCCDFSEYDSPREAASEYGWEAPAQEEDETHEEWQERGWDEALDWLRERTTVIEAPESIIIQCF